MKKKFYSFLAFVALLAGGSSVKAADGTTDALQPPMVGTSSPEVDKQYYLYNVDVCMALSSAGHYGRQAVATDDRWDLMTVKKPDDYYRFGFTYGSLKGNPYTKDSVLFVADGDGSGRFFTHTTPDIGSNKMWQKFMVESAEGNHAVITNVDNGWQDIVVALSGTVTGEGATYKSLWTGDRNTNNRWLFVTQDEAPLLKAKIALYKALTAPNAEKATTEYAAAKGFYTTSTSTTPADYYKKASSLLEAVVTSETTVDLTYRVQDPSFENNNRIEGTVPWTVCRLAEDGQTVAETTGTKPRFKWNNEDNWGGDSEYNLGSAIGWYLFCGDAGTSVSQKLENMPIGIYEMKVVVDGNVTLTYPGGTKDVTTGTAIVTFNYRGIEENGFTIGASSEGASYKVDDFHLTYFGQEQADARGLIDMITALENPSFETGTLNGWNLLSNAASAETGVKSTTSNRYRYSGTDGEYLYNAWDGDGKGAGISQTVTLPEGLYLLETTVASYVGNVVKPFAGEGDNNTLLQKMVSKKWFGEKVLLPFVVIVPEGSESTVQKVALGLANCDNWYKADNFHLYKISDYEMYIAALKGEIEAAYPKADLSSAYSAATEVKDGTNADKANAIKGLIQAKENQKNDKVMGFNFIMNGNFAVRDMNAANFVWTIDNAGANLSIQDRQYYDGTSTYLDVNSDKGGNWTLNLSQDIALEPGLYNFSFAGRGEAVEEVYVELRTKGTNGEELVKQNINLHVFNGPLNQGWELYEKAITLSKKTPVTLTVHAKTTKGGWFGVTDFLLQKNDTKAVSDDGQSVRMAGEFTTADMPTLTDAHTYVDLSQAQGSATLTAVNPNMIVNYGADKEGKPALSGTANEMVNGTVANFTLTDSHPFATPVEFTATAATYSRTMANAFGTVVLPYPVKSDETVRYYQLESVSEGEAGETPGIMTFKPVDELPANTPALCKKLDDEATKIEQTLETVTVPVNNGAEVENQTEVGSWKMVGAYQKSVIDNVKDEAHSATSYYAISKNQFWYATGKLTINPFRAYFTVPATTDGAQVASFGLSFGDDDVTGVQSALDTRKMLVVLSDKNALTLMAGEAVTYAVYTTGGVQVGRGSLKAGESHTMHVPAGIYVVNGIKVAVR